MAEMFKAEIHGLDLFEKQMKDVQEIFGDLKPLFRRLRRTILNIIDDNFDTEGTASGEKWQELSEKYNKRKILQYGMGKKILEASGDLRKSFTSKIDKTSLTVGTAKEYAAIHNFGMDEKNMPQREFMLKEFQIGDLSYEVVTHYFEETHKRKIKLIKGEI